MSPLPDARFDIGIFGIPAKEDRVLSPFLATEFRRSVSNHQIVIQLVQLQMCFFYPLRFWSLGFQSNGRQPQNIDQQYLQEDLNIYQLVLWPPNMVCEILWNIWCGSFGLLYTPFYHSLRSGSDIITCRRRCFSIAIEVSLRTIGYCAFS